MGITSRLLFGLLTLALLTNCGTNSQGSSSGNMSNNSEGDGSGVTGPNQMTYSSLTLHSNQAITVGAATLIMQSDCNLVVYLNKGTSAVQAVWSTKTGTGNCGSGVVMNFQSSDGNLVLYENGSSYWSSKTQQATPAVLTVMDQSPYLTISRGTTVDWTASP